MLCSKTISQGLKRAIIIMNTFIKYIKYIRKYFPAFVKKPIIQLQQKWNSKIMWDKQLIKNLMEYYSLSYDETKCMLKLGRRLFCDFWKELSPQNDEAIISFYKIPLPYNVFSLVYWHMTRGQIKFRKEIVKHSFGDVLDYGGGIGDLSVKLAEKGLSVTYAEINGKNMEFAKWLFKKRGKDNITVLDVEKDQERIWAKEYDTIVCIDVIEHIPYPEDVLKKMARHLKNNGRLIITALECSGPKDDAPMHLKIEFDAEKLLNSFGVFKSDRHDWLWINNLKS